MYTVRLIKYLCRQVAGHVTAPLRGHIQSMQSRSNSFQQATLRADSYRQAIPLTARTDSYGLIQTGYPSGGLLLVSQHSVCIPGVTGHVTAPLRGLEQPGYTSYSSYRLIWTHTDRLPLWRTCTHLSALSMHSRRHRSHVRSRYYHKRLHTCGDLSITPKFNVAPQQRPLFIYFNIYHLGFIQIIACVSSDVSIISSHHSTSASFHFCAY
jgi:hypothetical protein